MIAALFVERGGVYWNLDGVDPWDAERDARLYPGPWPVVAHPPCERWGRFARAGGRKLGDDAGCFAAALTAVRVWGGVLEHPADSRAWDAFGLPVPPRGGGWVRGVTDRSWVCEVEQGHYGHRAKKRTWLYACRIRMYEVPRLRWGRSSAGQVPEKSIRSAIARGVLPSRVGAIAVMSKRQRAATPIPFRDLLLSIARSVPARSEAA